ncbi:hypothetical protein Ndes2526A_g09284 [Nannochloris sp. 'desiccata']
MYSEAELCRLQLPQCFIALVLDGHGMLGEVCAQEAADEIYPKQAPEERRYTLTKHHSGNICYSHPIGGPRLLEFGTTATAVLVQGRTLAVAHAGDSLVVIGREEGEDTYSGEYVTERHSGSHQGERQRLESYAGKKVKIRVNDGYISVPCPSGPIGTFSLAMTRALGHKMMSDYGVIPTPTVTLRTLGPQDVCVIAASDGVWEGLDPEQAVREVCDSMAQGRDANSAAQALCTDAVKQVMALDKRIRADNTTAALIIFDEVIGEGNEEQKMDDGGGSGGEIEGGGTKRKHNTASTAANENGNGNSNTCEDIGKSHNGVRRPKSKPTTSPLSSPGALKQNAAPSSSKSSTQPTDLEDLVRRRYFEDLFTGGDYTLASKILDPGVIHRDMVRDEQYSGVEEIIEYMRQIKQTYPSFLVRATEIAASPDGNSMFVAFEGHAAEGMPLFRGIDRIYFTTQNGDSGGAEKKIKEVDVYRSNWQGAKGHAQRKLEMEEQLSKEERDAEEKRKHKKR